MLDNLKKYDIVLASGSPRRRELLAGLGVDFRVELLKGIEENYPEELSVKRIPKYLSQLKSHAYKLVEGEMLITADTVVVLHGEVMGKPRGVKDAKIALARLSGNTHSVITGVTVATLGRTESFSCETRVEFDELTQEEIAYYVDRFKPLDKAGSYGIQEWIGYVGIKRIDGSFYNVMGLPVQRLYQLLKSF